MVPGKRVERSQLVPPDAQFEGRVHPEPADVCSVLDGRRNEMEARKRGGGGGHGILRQPKIRQGILIYS